jgi:hypothetical protein
MPILVKIHRTYREVIAVCDSELIGKKFEEGKIQLEVTEAFFGGDEMDGKEAVKTIKERLAEDACFNFVGTNSVNAGIKAGAIDKNCVMKVQGIPYALLLV